jgi:hypothetical protein
MSMKYGSSKADPCLYFRWTALWVDDCLVAGKQKGVYEAKSAMMERFDCDDDGELKKCVGCKIDYNKKEGSMKITQCLQDKARDMIISGRIIGLYRFSLEDAIVRCNR